MSVTNFASPEELAKRLHRLEEETKLRHKLPHLYAFPHYKWSREFFESTNRMNILVAANQLSKSSTQIRKHIEWATNKELWPKLWPGRTPRQFWQLYPDKNVSTAEWYTKWEPEFMPRFLSKEERLADPVYGYDVEFEQGKIKAIWWNSGVVTYFKPYSTDIQALQSGSCDAIFLDEEAPVSILDELLFRLSATLGYFHIVFTATLSQTLWYEAIECRGKPNEKFPDAAKWQVSKWDCLYYEDGSPSPWTPERIKAEERMCSTDAEVKRRVWGRFVKSDRLCVPQFMASKHLTYNPSGGKGTIPPGWSVYGAVDIGAGKATKVSHPAAIVFLAVSPKRDKARVIKLWRGDGLVTTCGDILDKFLEMEAEIEAPIVKRTYDQASTEFFLIAQARGHYFDKADKARDRGFETMNTLFKCRALEVDKELEDSDKLTTELETVTKDAGEEVLDDLLSALRYGCMSVPWDWAVIVKNQPDEPLPAFKEAPVKAPPTPAEIEAKRKAQEIRDRRGEYDPEQREDDPVYDELSEWQEYL